MPRRPSRAVRGRPRRAGFPRQLPDPRSGAGKRQPARPRDRLNASAERRFPLKCGAQPTRTAYSGGCVACRRDKYSPSAPAS